MGLIDKNIENYGLISINDAGLRYIASPSPVTVTLDHDYDREEQEAEQVSARGGGAACSPCLKTCAARWPSSTTCRPT